MSGDSGSSLRAVMYGENDLSSTELFSGHFINFGYWKDLTPGQRISVEERTESQANLYRTVLSRLQIDPDDVLLEVGCGIGVGAALALREFEPSAVWALDYSQDQLDRARRVHAELLAQQPDQLVLRQGSALALPYEDSTFATEAHRVLKPGGRLCATTFFTPHANATQDLRHLIETIDSGIDVPAGGSKSVNLTVRIAPNLPSSVESIVNDGIVVKGGARVGTDATYTVHLKNNGFQADSYALSTRTSARPTSSRTTRTR